MDPVQEPPLEPQPSEDPSAQIPAAPPLLIDIEVASVAQKRPRDRASASKPIEKEARKLPPLPAAQLHQVMILGKDEFNGPVMRSFHEALYEGVDRLVVSYEIASTALSTAYSKKIQELDLEESYASKKNAYDTLLKSSLDPLTPDSSKNQAIKEQVTTLKDQLEQDKSMMEAQAEMVAYNHKWIFSRYQIQLHESGSYLVFTRKGVDRDPQKSIPDLPADRFVPIRNYTQLGQSPIHGSAAEAITPIQLLDSLPTQRGDMVLYMLGHGFEEGGEEIAGIAPEQFQGFLQSIEKQDHRDLIVVTSCYSGGKVKQYFPGNSLAERAASKTTYVVTNLGSVVSVKGKIADFSTFFEKAGFLLAYKGKQLKDYQEVIHTVSASVWMNQPQVRFPSTGPFQAVRDSSAVFNLTSVRLLGQLTQDPKFPLVIPAGIQMMDVHHQDVPISVQLPIIPPSESFAIFTHQPFSRIKELIAPPETSLISLVGGFRNIWEMPHVHASAVAIDRIAIHQGLFITDVNISIPESDVDRRPRMSFFDEKHNFYTVDLCDMRVNCFGRPDAGDEVEKEQQALLEKLFFPMTILNFRRDQLKPLTVSHVKAGKRAAALEYMSLSPGEEESIHKHYGAGIYQLDDVGSLIYRLRESQMDKEEIIEIPQGREGLDCPMGKVERSIRTPLFQSNQPFPILGSPHIELAQIILPFGSSAAPLLFGAKPITQKPQFIQIKKLTLEGELELEDVTMMIPSKESGEPPLFRFFDEDQNLYIINIPTLQVARFAKEDQSSIDPIQLLNQVFPGIDFSIVEGDPDERLNALKATGGSLEDMVA